ncbi:hypothetical protein QBC38DRAFT_503228 [Podospora fimiseda]|uniref:Uncharacterized protein n=1 Tax=Podospora fimiseda TaxID=252190 RepID=A0AAN7BHF0_9PEZI|nr:hypothetical protein QBC38DRAFT_503228 [Podospora fimiseda]
MRQLKTTALSYRSHGDNTTGAPTAIMAPNAGPDVDKELQLAKALVLETQTAEEIEGESWEATMLPDVHYMEVQTQIQWRSGSQSFRLAPGDFVPDGQLHRSFSLRQDRRLHWQASARWSHDASRCPDADNSTR